MLLVISRYCIRIGGRVLRLVGVSLCRPKAENNAVDFQTEKSSFIGADSSAVKSVSFLLCGYGLGHFLACTDNHCMFP